MNWNVWPGFSVPESNVPDGVPGVPLVTVCGVPFVSSLLHVTVVPARTVNIFGLYAMFLMETDEPDMPPWPGVIVGAAAGLLGVV